MAKKGKYERVDNNKKKNNSQPKQKSKQTQNKNHSQKKTYDTNKQQNKQQTSQKQDLKQTQPKQQDVPKKPKTQSEAANRNPMNATKFTPVEQMPELVKSNHQEPKAQSKVQEQSVEKHTIAEKVVESQVTAPQRPYEKRQAEKTTKTSAKKEKKKSQKPSKQKQQELKDQSMIEESYRQYELGLRQAEKEGVIAGVVALLALGIIVGGYYLLSLAYPAISVDAMADRLIEGVFMWFVDMTQRPPDLERLPIFGDFLQWLGDKWNAMVF